MRIVENGHVVCFDVDDTLIKWLWDQFEIEQLRAEGALLVMEKNGESVAVKPIQEHIELIKRYKVKGKFIIVWSQSGYQWVSEVVKALGIDHLVDLCLTKPEKYVDDLKADEWMEHVYLGTINKTTPNN